MLHALIPLTLLLLTPQSQPPVGVGPEPSPTPIAWELEFRFLDPRPIEVQLPGTDRPEVYWYMVYTVVNTNPRSQRFYPMFQIVTEDLRVFDTDMGINPLVFDAIRQRHRITHKYLVEPTKAIGALLTGEDNARESVAVWRQIDLTVNNFTVFVAGLSGETQFLRNPSFDPEQPEMNEVIGLSAAPQSGANPRHFTLRKTLEIRYTVPGSPQARPTAAPQRTEVRWIMR